MVRLGRVVAALSVLTMIAGCNTAADAGRSFGSDELVTEIASRLTTSQTVSYTATYSLASTTTATIAHHADPEQTAYRYPGGMLLVTPAVSTLCQIAKTAKCQTTSAAARGTNRTLTLDDAMEKVGLVRPETVVSLLTQTSLDPDAVISEGDRTIAGTNATCVTITGVAAPFTACVTTDGLLGSFTGTVGTANVDISLDHYLLSVTSDAFALPPGAKTSTNS